MIVCVENLIVLLLFYLYSCFPKCPNASIAQCRWLKTLFRSLLLSLLCFHSPGTWASLVPFQVTNGTQILPTNVHQNYSINIIGEPPLLHTEAENWRPVGGGGEQEVSATGEIISKQHLKQLCLSFVLCPPSPPPFPPQTSPPIGTLAKKTWVGLERIWSGLL